MTSQLIESNMVESGYIQDEELIANCAGVAYAGAFSLVLFHLSI